MPIVNFSVPKTLDRRITELRRHKGFASKAEFYRFAAIYFIDVIEKPIANEEERFGYLAQELSQEISARYRGKKISSLKEQLKNV